MAKTRNRNNRTAKTGNHDVLGITLVAISAFFLLCIAIKPILGIFSEAIFSVFLGVFGIASYPMLLGILILGIFLLMRRPMYIDSVKTVVCIVLLVLFGLIILQLASTHAFLKEPFSDYIADTYSAKYSAGGVIMGAVAFGLKSLITEVGCYIVFSLAIAVVVLIMTSAVSRLMNRRKKPKKSEPVVPERSNMFSGTEAQRVVMAMPRQGLFVSTIERNTPPPAMQTETGVASQVPTQERRNVSDYPSSPVIERPAPRDVVYERSESLDRARSKLYGDSDSIRKQTIAEFGRATGDVYASAERAPVVEEAVREEPVVAEPVEPAERVNRDAQQPPVETPRRVDYVGTPPNFNEIFFPVDKHFDFNDEGIESIEDDLGARLQEHSEERTLRDLGIINGGKTSGPSFGIPSADYAADNAEEIIDASAIKNTPPAPPPPVMPPPEAYAPVNTDPIIAADDSLLRSKSSNVAKAEPIDRTPVLETEKFKQEDILDAFEVRERFKPAREETADELPEDEDERDDILDGSAAPEAAVPEDAPESVIQPSPSLVARPIADDPGDEDIITDENIDGLIISGGPATDKTENADNVSDLLTGEQLSGMYITEDDNRAKEDGDAPQASVKPRKQKSNAPIENQISIDNVIEERAKTIVVADTRRYKSYNYQPPSLDLLIVPETDVEPQEDSRQNAVRLEEVISGFLKTDVKVIGIAPGPQVTRYELDVPQGVSVKQIGSHDKDIAYELAATGAVRIEAPIPGKRAVGIEVPNKEQATVRLREVLESKAFTSAKSPIVFSVGKDVGGEYVVCDLEKVPHLLIAGQTGSGKSAGLNSLIVSLLYKSSPEDLRFILIDPKRVEFSKFCGMPHMLIENAIVTPNEALNALKWAVKEMDRRFIVLQQSRCSKLSEYNNHPDVLSGKKSKLPHIVIIIDELANLMMSPVGNEIETTISQIAALARASGIHLIVATQRPSIDVITGTIKANLTSRMAFKVSTATNSRIILDNAGAETLSGNGDMLFFPDGYPMPKRVQGSFVTGGEILSVVESLKSSYESDFDAEAEHAIFGSGGDGGTSGGDAEEGGNSTIDPFTPRILAHAIKNKQISTSVIQRRFSIGYARAARIIDYMVDNGYIGPATGNSKPRDVLMTEEQYRETFGHDINDIDKQ